MTPEEVARHPDRCGTGLLRAAGGGHTREERDTDTALHESMQPDRPMPRTVLARVRALARRMGIPPGFVQR